MALWLLKSCILLLVLAGSGLQARLIPPLSLDSAQLEGKGSYSISTRVDDNSEGNYRLPNNTAPEEYRVELWTNVHNGTREFNGYVEIDIQVLELTTEIKLNYRQTEAFNASIISRSEANASEVLLNVAIDSQREFLTFTPTDSGVSFAADTIWTLRVAYTGILRSDMGGFHRTSYTDDEGTEHFVAATQFESTNARHAFPSYDEPARRANFTITIHHDPSFTALSNMPVNESVSSPGITVFQTTPKMSTYLVAFVISDFNSTTGELNGLRQRVLSQQGKQDQQEWALLSGLVVESSLAGYFGVPFALPKLDQVGVPGKGGAMENWGLATYGEQYMWWTKENSTIELKTSIANIIGHEYAHMWFGDLVSIQWWTYLWLKEGFATIFSYESNDIAFPEWNTYQIYHVQDYNSALINDALVSAVPMTHYVQTPAEISSRYNTFSYAKPSAVLYMFKNAWTDRVFRQGLNKYLTKNQYNSCDEWDLFASFQESADELGHTLPTSVNNIFSSWSQQAGYPLLTVTRNYQTGAVTITQKRYVEDKDDANQKTWYVPVNFATASNPDYRDTRASHYLMNVTETVITDVASTSDDWLLVNKQNTFYYRTLYDLQNYQLLADTLNNQIQLIHPRNRAQLLYDTYFFVNTNRLDHSVLFQLLTYLEKEDQYAPWSNANSILTVYQRYFRAEEYNTFESFVSQLTNPILLKIGVNEIPGEHYLTNYLRNVIVSLACQVGNDECHLQSEKKLSEFLFNGTAIEPSLRTQAYCAGLRNPSQLVYNRVVDNLLQSTNPTDRSLFISSLGCPTSGTQLASFLRLSLDSTNGLSYAERTSLLNSAYTKSNYGVKASLEFLESNWEAYGNLSDTEKPLDSDLRGIASYVVGDAEKTRLNTLVEEIKSKGAKYIEDDLSATIETRIQANFEWLNENREPVINWLSEYLKSDDNSSPIFTSSLTTIFVSTMALFLLRLI